MECAKRKITRISTTPYEPYNTPVTPGVHEKVIHTKTNLQLSVASLFKYV